MLQHSVDRDLHLYKDMKNQKEYIACVKMVSLSSQPINHEYNQNGHRKLFSSDIGKFKLYYSWPGLQIGHMLLGKAQTGLHVRMGHKIGIGIDIPSVLVWVQTVCRG